MSTKVSISLDEADARYLDEQARGGRFASRSAAVHEAIRVLRESQLLDAYAEAFADWREEEWDAATGDGIGAA